MRTIATIIVSLVLVTTHLQSQDLLSDIAATQQFFESENSYRVQINTWQKYANTAKPQLISETTVKRMEDRFRYEMPNFISIVLPSKFLLINEESKEIIYQEVQMPKPDMGLKLEYLEKMISTVEFKGVFENQRQYRIKMDNPLYDYALVYTHPTNGFLEKVQYYYSEAAKDEPIYLEQTLSISGQTMNRNEFEMKKYITDNNNDITLSAQYSDFSLLY